MWMFGVLIGIIICFVYRQIEIKENHKDCVYDEETKCWHRIM